MNKAKWIFYIAAIVFGVYAIFMLVFNFSAYASYIEYYGLGEVLAVSCDTFFTNAAWALVLLGFGLLCGHFGKQEPKKAVEATADLPLEKAVEEEPVEAEADFDEDLEEIEVAVEAEPDQAAEPKDAAAEFVAQKDAE